MKSTHLHILSIAAALSLLPSSIYAQARFANVGKSEAMHMVPATAILLDSLDARKMEPGAEFKARLRGTVHLANGRELPSGTVLDGTVVTDDMKDQGNSKLAVRFTQAHLKDGSTMPIKATIVGAYTPGDEEVSSYDERSSPPPNSWNDGTLQVDQLGVTSGVDLHSKVISANSGVFVTTSKDDVKLGRGSAMNLAIAEQSNSQHKFMGGNSAS